MVLAHETFETYDISSWVGMGLFLKAGYFCSLEKLHSPAVMQSIQVKASVKHYVFVSQLDSSTRGH